MLKTESYRRGTVISTLLNIGAKGIGFLNTLTITYFFGSLVQTDLYFYIISVTALVASSINGIDLLIIVPESMRIREQVGQKEAEKFGNFFLWTYFSLGALLTLTAYLFPVSFYSFFSKFDKAKLETFQAMLYAGSIFIVFQLVNGLMTSILTSYKYFTVPIFAGLINSVFAISFTFFFHSRLGITGTMLGLLSGYLINFIILAYTMRKRLRWNFFSVALLRDKKVWKNILLMQINILPNWVRNYLMIFLLTGLGAGVLTGLNLAQNLIVLPDVFITSQIVAIGGIKFSELNAKKDFERLKIFFSDLLIFLLVLIIPVSIVFVLSADDIISFVYVRGNFNSSSAGVPTLCFMYLAMLLAFNVVDTIFTRLFTALQLYGITVLVAFIAHSLFTALTYYLTVYFKLEGYFWSLLIGSYGMMSIAYIIIIQLKAKFLLNTRLISNLFRLILLTVVVFFICYYFKQCLHFGHILNIIFMSVAAAVLFWPAAYFFIHLEPARQVVVKALQKIKLYNKS